MKKIKMYKIPCKRCGKIIISKTLRKRYCDDCSEELNKKYARENYRRKKNERKI